MPTSHPKTQSSKKVFVWIESTPTTNLRVCDYLSPAEKERAEKYKTQQLQDRFIAARGRLREILGNHLGILPNSIEFTYNAFGKPSIHPKHASRIHFNLSHSHDRFAIALTEDVRIGIDIERYSNVKNLYKIIFSEQELKFFNNLTANDKIEQFFRAWTLKEAYVKALGCGLNMDIRAIEVFSKNIQRTLTKCEKCQGGALQFEPGGSQIQCCPTRGRFTLCERSRYNTEDLFLSPWTLSTIPMEREWACAIAVEMPNPFIISCKN